MGKRTRAKKHANKNGETSISTSSTSTALSQPGANHTTDTPNKIEGGNASNKVKDESANNPSQVQAQGSVVKEGPVLIDDLPPEMLASILKFLDIQSLLKSRVVSRKWCEISSDLLSKRPAACIRFELDFTNEFVWKNILDERKSLADFLKCMKISKIWPYTHFDITIDSSSSSKDVFDQKDFKEFLSHFASSNEKRIKWLGFRFNNLVFAEQFQFFIQKLGDLLLNKVPYLENLSLQLQRSVEAPQVKLFPTSETTKQPQMDFQLPNVKNIAFSPGPPMISRYTEITRDLLNAAVNLTKFSMTIQNLEDFQFLHSLEKLSVLKETEIHLDQHFFSTTTTQTQKCKPWEFPKLEFLHLKMSMTKMQWNEIFFSQATNFLANLFESSKDTLKELCMQPLGFLSKLQLPTFKNLRKLRISQYNRVMVYGSCDDPIFPPGIRTRDVFPAVVDFGMDIECWSGGFPQQDSIPLLPGLKTLTIRETGIDGDVISILALMCPSLQKFKIHRETEYDEEDYDGDSPELNFAEVGRSIWTHMKGLEFLEVDFDLESEENNSAALDSCFTGISEENCLNLFCLREADEKSPYKSKQDYGRLTVREYPSILDMKDLKKFTINGYLDGLLLDKEEFFSDAFSWVSQEYAFKLMPHLKLNED